MITLHGIKNCDSVRKARRWLQQHDIAYQFRDLRETPPDTDELLTWLQRCSWQVLVNKRSTTWKNLEEDARTAVTDASSAANLLAQHPTLIKRPVLSTDQTLQVGFKAEDYEALLTKA